jgi:hypothetical protein
VGRVAATFMKFMMFMQTMPDPGLLSRDSRLSGGPGPMRC